MTAGTEAAAAAWATEILGRERVLIRHEERLQWTLGGCTPQVVAVPRTTDEVAALLERAFRSGVPVAPAGAGTWLRGGDPPGEVGLLVSTREMDRILHYEPADLTLTAGAGCRLEVLDRETRVHGQWLPVDPPGGAKGTLGAAIATASVGSLRTCYGGLRNMVLGLTIVTGRGEILRLGGRVVKNVAGFDLCRLMVGSWGTLGIVTEATIRLHPRPAARRRLTARRSRAVDLVGPALEAGDAVPGAARVVLEEQALEEGGRAAVLVVDVHGSEAAVEAQVGRLRERTTARWEEEETPLPGSTGGGGDMVIRLRLSRTQLEELVGLAEGLSRGSAERGGFRTAPVRTRFEVDALEGSMRISVQNLRTDGPWATHWADRLEDLRRTLELRRGSLSLEEAPPEIARRVSARGAPSGAEGELTGRIRSAFDPAGILVPARPPGRATRP